jgi:hypothetical protein
MAIDAKKTKSLIRHNVDRNKGMDDIMRILRKITIYIK